MSSPGYVWEKMYVAIDCMCGRGSLAERIENAATAALIRLNETDLEGGDLREDLEYVLNWTKHNVRGGKVIKLPDDVEHEQLIKKMLHILLETHEA